MLRIKRLYLYILQTFVPVFFMTFAICLFIILMQFLWKYVEDLVGKGLEPHVLAELFAYAALSLVPMALPLAILLASLMTFGNLGERFELTAIKAAGISLLKAMRPLILLIAAVSVGAFYFQNDVIPRVNVKFRTLMISIKQKSPELQIPENTFSSDINNYNLFVKEKDKETGMLRDVMIYDVSKGFDNMAVIVCDSAKMRTSSNKDYLSLTLYYGQQFSNVKQSGFRENMPSRSEFVPYSREIFKEKQVIIPFDANFNRIDESAMEGTQLAKNVTQLRSSIDSLSKIVDSLNVTDRKVMVKYAYVSSRNNTPQDSVTVKNKADIIPISFDSVVNSLSMQEKQRIYSDAFSLADNSKSDMLFRSFAKIDLQKKIRGHNVELQKKFTLSFACLVFFFIGAPLGAIIRKGGLGMPVVISVILFIIYYIIDNVGFKMARDGVWPVWQGVWLSSFILFPLGAFITYKAINDSALFNADAYRNFYIRLFGERAAMPLEELYKAYNRNVKYGLLALAGCVLFLLMHFLTKGFLSNMTAVLASISGIIYLVLFSEFVRERYEFYKKAQQKIRITVKEIAFVLTIGLFFYFVLYLYYKNRMANIIAENESKMSAVQNI